MAIIYQHFTAWFFLNGEGKKTYWTYGKPKSTQEVVDDVVLAYPLAQDILIWGGNWFGMTNNPPEPDEKYGIKPERE